MSGQLEHEDTLDRETILKDFGEKFKSGSKLETAKAPDDVKGPDKGAEGAGLPADGGKPTKPASDAAGKVDKPRDDAGKFAPAPEPFEGFNDLDPKIQRQFKNLKQERDKYQNDYKAVEGRLQPLQREYQRLQQHLEAPKQTGTQGQKKVDDFLTSDEFKDFAERYPQDALGIKKGLQETVDQLRSEVADSSKPLAEKLTQVEAKLGEYERERESVAAQKQLDRLNDTVPSWKLIAGWEKETDDGKVISVDDPAQRVWHPWFDAWRGQLPHSVRHSYDQLLNEASADSIGHVFTMFIRDVEAHQAASGQQQADDVGGSSAVQERRSEQLRDISPRPSRSGADQPLPTLNGGGGGDRAAVLAQFYDKFKAGQKLR